MTATGPDRLAVRPIDPFAPCRPGRYADDVVVVLREDRRTVGVPARRITATEHFVLARRGKRVEIRHRIAPDELDNDVAGLLADELFAPGWLSGCDVFERAVTGVVRSCVDDATEAWRVFYRNTLARIHECWSAPDEDGTHPHSSIAGFAPVYRRALRLVPPGPVLDLGSYFGFLPLLLAARTANSVTATDVVPGTARLLATVSGPLGVRIATLSCDAARVPLPDGSVDTVTVVNLLEHLEPPHGDAVVREAVRLARRRVVVAVPYEDEPTAAYGHVRTFDRATLLDLGQRAGHPCTVDSYHGGWLVVQLA